MIKTHKVICIALTLAAIAWVIIFQMMIKHVVINGSRELTAIYQAHAQDQTIKSYESDVMKYFTARDDRLKFLRILQVVGAIVGIASIMKYFEIRRAQIRLQSLPQGLGTK